MPVQKDFRIVDDFYLWEAYQGINNGRTIEQFRVVDNFYLYQVIISGIAFSPFWVYGGEHDISEWQPNATAQGEIIVGTIPAGHIVTEYALIKTVAFKHGFNSIIDLLVTAFIPDNTVMTVRGKGNLNQQGTTFWAPVTSPDTALSQNGTNINLPYDVVIDIQTNDGHVIDDITQGKCKVWWRQEKLPSY